MAAILLNHYLNNNLLSNKLSSTYQDKLSQLYKIDFVPELDVIETKESFIIETELPGVNKEDIQVEIKESKLFIQGEKKRSLYITKNNLNVLELTVKPNTEQPSIEEFEDNIKSTTTAVTDIKEQNTAVTTPKDQLKKYISERSYGNFKRYLDLTRVLYTLDLSTIKSQFNNGLLTIIINKKQDYSNTIKINL